MLKNKPGVDDIPIGDVGDWNQQGPALLYEKFQLAFCELKSTKVQSIDGISGELLKLIRVLCDPVRYINLLVVVVVYEICNTIYLTGELPQDCWNQLLFKLRKKNGVQVGLVDIPTILREILYISPITHLPEHSCLGDQMYHISVGPNLFYVNLECCDFYCS